MNKNAKILLSIILLFTLMFSAGCAAKVEPVITKEPDTIDENVPQLATDGSIELEIEEPEVIYQSPLSDEEAILIAKIVYREAGGVHNKMYQSAVIWCILNRVDAGYGTITEVCKAPNQFAYIEDTPVYEDLVALANDVAIRWIKEKDDVSEVGRTLPSEYLWFSAGSGNNNFRDAYSAPYNVWNWQCVDPYTDIQ